MSEASRHPDPPSVLPEAGGSYVFESGAGRKRGRLVPAGDGEEAPGTSAGSGGDAADAAGGVDATIEEGVS